MLPGPRLRSLFSSAMRGLCLGVYVWPVGARAALLGMPAAALLPHAWGVGQQGLASPVAYRCM